ncbi:MAG: TatD family deoxyribonuclease [Alphaproteobacteria bacterium]|nr:TatD family deoxyribonuclease [Alphaproteobacteria bacterium]
MNLQLIDTHCHLDFPEFKEQRDAVVQRARDAGVKRMITICTHASRIAGVKDVAQSYDDVFCSIGVHPHHSGEEGELVETAWLIEQSKYEKVVGLGETGLDYYYNNSPVELQKESFRRHIRASLETDLPLIVHTRDADDDTYEILKSEGQGRLRGLLHCFSSGAKLAQQAVEMGFYLSLSGIVTFKKSQELRDIVKDIPLESILVETDAPFLAPMPHRGRTNEPAYVVHTAAAIAEVKGVSLEEFSAITTANALRVFNRMSAPE